MKFAYILAFVMLISFSVAMEHSYTELIEDLKKPAVEVTVAQLLSGFETPEVKELVGGEAYAIARTGVGCGAGVFGGLNTGFTIYDIISQDPTDFESYIFGVLYAIAWWQQNGQYLEYMCTNFWHLIHH